MTNKNLKLQKQIDIITRRIFIRLVIALAIYSLAGVATYGITMIIYNLFIWQGDEILYKIVHLFDMNSRLIMYLYITIGFCIIFFHYIKKPFQYFETIVEATEYVYHSDDSLIVLPHELQEIELQMNQIKMTVRNSERIAKEAEQRKNDLVIYLAHDLKTPLTSVIGYLTLLRDENQISEELREKYLTISLEKAERLETLINEFFEIARFNLTDIKLELSKVNLTRMLEQLTYEFKPMLSDKNLNYTLNAAPDIMIKCDVDKMQRVFDNLLRNAVNYSFENTTITITVTQLEHEIKLSFMNHGNAIPREKLDRIFEQFYRLDSARTTKSGGAGLGLAIAKEIVELHHGTITAFCKDEVIAFELTIPVL